MRPYISSLFVAGLMLAATVSYGQSFSFRVLANKGNNEVKRADRTESLRTGSSLFAGDEIIASSGAYIGLMHKTGKTYEVKEAGVFKISDLERKMNTGASSSASRYANYIMAKMNESDGGTNYKQNMAVTGAVERATSNSAIQVLLPNSIDIYNEDAIIRWNEIDDAEGYTVTLKNIFDEEVMREETDKSMLKLDFSSEALAKERLVILNVKVTGNDDITSGDYGIKRMARSDAQTVSSDIEALRADVEPNSPLSKLIEASYYEDNNLLLDALTKYEEAITLAPEVEDFQDLYEGFIIKNGLGN
ncbi:MAG: hypothetical protein AAGC88_16300 [Bacteroidota bacterium]